MKTEIFISSHTHDINGTQHCAILRKLEINLKNYGKNFKILTHPMNIAQKSQLYNSITKKTEKVGYKINFSIFRYLYEIFLNIYFLRKEYINNKCITYIGIDPLNALSGVIAKKMGYIKKNIFYTPDYSPTKFTNPLLNKIYHTIDTYSAKNADEVWNASSRITEVRNNLGVKSSKNIFLPNVPGKIYISNNPKNKHTLITSGNLDVNLEYKNLFSAISELKHIYKDIKLYIAGDGKLKKEIDNYIKKNNYGKFIILLGFMDMQSYLGKVSESGIGLAMYNGKWGFNYYGDSTKCREFMHFGLPILTTSFHSTADEINKNKCGIIDDEMSKESYIKNLQKLFDNYDSYSKNSKELGEKNNTICTKIIGNL